MSQYQLNVDATVIEDEGTLFKRETSHSDADDSHLLTAETEDELLLTPILITRRVKKNKRKKYCN